MTARKLIVTALLMTALIGGAGCVHSIDIQQGNFLEPKDVDRVAVGIEARQKEIASKFGYQLVDHSMILYGRCKRPGCPSHDHPRTKS